jgi:hypothetical protein
VRNRATRATRFGVCTDNRGYAASLEVGKLYPVVPDAEAAQHGYIRVIDESGEDYLFPRTQFAFVDFPQAVRRKILALQKAS